MNMKLQTGLPRALALLIGGSAALASVGGPVGAAIYIGLGILRNKFEADAQSKQPNLNPLAKA